MGIISGFIAGFIMNFFMPPEFNAISMAFFCAPLVSFMGFLGMPIGLYSVRKGAKSEEKAGQ